MSETTAPTAAGEQKPARRRPTSLNTMLLADLKSLAGGLGIKGASTMKKAQLVEAIKAHQDAFQASKAQAGDASAAAGRDAGPDAGRTAGEAATEPRTAGRGERGSRRAGAAAPEQTAEPADQQRGGAVAEELGEQPQQQPQQQGEREGGSRRRQRGDQQRQQRGEQADQPVQGEQATQADQPGAGETREESRDGRQGRAGNRDGGKDGQNREGQNREGQNREGQNRDGQGKGGQQGRNAQKENQKDGQNREGQNREGQNRDGQNRDGQNRDGQNRDRDRDHQGKQQQKQSQQPSDRHDDDDLDDEGGSRRNRRRRGRERNATRSAGGRNEPDTTILEDDVLVPAAGILDVLDNYAFVRTSGYLPGTDDVYLSLSMVRRYGLRRGDAVVGQVRQPREGERREKFNPMVRIDSVNGLDPETAKDRPEFDGFTPVHPSTRLRLETGPDNLLGRIVDVVAPIGKGQRGLVLSPPRSGKTQVLQTIAASIRHNNPECHVMVVLIDERPEEVTDYQRTVRGEVIASTFDRPAADHVLLSELAVERAKRLVELGHDVVVLLDSLTRLGRAHNVAGPGSGRVGHGGVDAVALHPALKLFGAARNVEDGGSLTILATALVESGSPLDEAVLDEFNDTSNMELRLRRELVERRVYPPVDVVASGTRREEHLLTPEEQEITWKLRSALMDLEPGEALRRVLTRINSTQNNVEFLTQVQKASAAELAKG